MSFDDSFYSADHNAYVPTRISRAGGGILRVVLLFGSAAIALALIIVPVLNNQAAKMAAQSVLPNGVDRTTTASIKRNVATVPAVEHAVQPRQNEFPAPVPASLCIIEADGSYGGDC